MDGVLMYPFLCTTMCLFTDHNKKNLNSLKEYRNKHMVNLFCDVVLISKS